MTQYDRDRIMRQYGFDDERDLLIWASARPEKGAKAQIAFLLLAVDKAAAEEREACAKVADGFDIAPCYESAMPGVSMTRVASGIADAIRARGET